MASIFVAKHNKNTYLPKSTSKSYTQVAHIQTHKIYPKNKYQDNKQICYNMRFEIAKSKIATSKNLKQIKKQNIEQKQNYKTTGKGKKWQKNTAQMSQL